MVGSNNEDDDDAEAMLNYWSIEEVIELWVESDYFDNGQDEIRIRNFTLESITSKTIGIQLNFKMPPKITNNIAEPDELKIKFIEGAIFVDRQSFSQLQQNMTIAYTIPPQINQDEAIELKNLGENVAGAMTTITITVLLI